MILQTALRMVYPPRCLGCGGLVDSDFGLCGTCWRDTPFIVGLVCNLCGTPLPGDGPDDSAVCDDCLVIARPWAAGRSALLYKDRGRSLVMALKHGDRHDIARAAAAWMAQAARPLLQRNMLIAPVPLHWTRLLRRKFNQSALLADGVARHTGLSWCPDLLERRRRTESLEGKGRDARFAALDGAISLHPRRRHRIAGRPVLLVDDVMTSGATLAAAAEACRASRAGEICVLTLARVAKDT